MDVNQRHNLPAENYYHAVFLYLFVCATRGRFNELFPIEGTIRAAG